MFPPRETAPFLHARDCARAVGSRTATEIFTILVAILDRNLEEVGIIGREVQFSEIEVFVEYLAERAERTLIFAGEEARGQIEAGRHVARRDDLLAFIRAEEEQFVADDRPAQGTAVLQIPAFGFPLRIFPEQFDRACSPQTLVGEIDETGPMELVGAGLRDSRDCDRSDLVEFRLVVGTDDAIFADRRLGERVALR